MENDFAFDAERWAGLRSLACGHPHSGSTGRLAMIDDTTKRPPDVHAAAACADAALHRMTSPLRVKIVSNNFYRDPAGLTPTVDSMIGSDRAYLNVVRVLRVIKCSRR